MPTNRTISIRLGLDGAVELKQQLEDAGITGGAALDKINAALERLGAQDPSAAIASMNRIAAAAADAQKAVGQAQANSFAGVQSSTSDADYTKRAADVAAYGAQLDALRAKYVPLFAASKAYETSLDEIGRAEKVGALSAVEAAAARDRLTASFSAAAAPLAAGTDAALKGSAAVTSLGSAHGDASKTVGLFGLDMQRSQVLVHDSIKTFAELGAGMPPLLVAMQHVGQAQYVFGDIGTAAKALVSAVFSPIGAVVALTGSVVALGIAAQHEGSHLADLRESLRLTHTDYASLADQVDASAKRVAASSSLTKSAAEAIGQSIASSRYLGSFAGDLDALTKSAANYARVAGIDGPAAGKLFKQAFDSPADAAKALAEQGLPAMDAALVRVIQRLDASGQSGKATSLVLNAIKTSTAGATEDLTPLGRAMEELHKSFTTVGQDGKSFATNVGDAIDAAVAKGVSALASLVRNLKSAYDGISKIGPGTESNQVEAYRQAYAHLNAGNTQSTSLTKADPSIQAALQAAADRQGIDVELLARLQLAENQRVQADGTWKLSSTGAVGPMQILPSTFGGIAGTSGQSINDPTANVSAGATLFAHLLRKYGDPTLAVLAYHDGETAVDQILSGAREASQEGLAEARTVVSGYGGTGLASARAAALGASVAPGPGDFLSQAPLGQGLTAAQTAALGNGAVLPDSVQRLLKPGGDGTQFQSQQAAADAIEAVTKAIGDLQATGQPAGDVLARLQALLAKAKSEAYSSVDATVALHRSATDSLVPFQQQAGAQRTVAEAVNAARVELERQGKVLSATDAAQVQSDALKTLAANFNDLIIDTDRQTASNQRLAASIDGGAPSYLAATNREKALAAARNDYLPGPEQDAAVNRYAAALDRTSASLADLATKQKAFDQRDQLTLLQAETAALGQNQDQAAKQIALLKEKQDLVKRGVDLQSAASQADLANVAAIADATAALQHQKDALGELTSFVDNTFSTISSAITQAFAVGSKSAIDFGSIAKGVVSAIEAEFIKLAAINPLKDALFGTTSPNLSSVGGIAGNLFGSGGSSGSGLLSGAASALGAGSSASPFDGPGGTIDTSGNLKADGNGLSLGTVASVGGTAAKTLDFISGGKLLDGVKSYVFDAVGYQPGTTIGQWVSGLVGETAGTVASVAGDVAGAAASAGVSAGGIAASTTAASVVGGEFVAAGAIGVAANTIAEAVPYIGAAISVVTDLIQGNYRGAGLVAGGALIGTAIFPGVGTAIGAALGAVVDMILPNHPKNPYQNTDVTVDDSGHIVAGRQVSQLEKTGQAAQSVTDFGNALGNYLDQIKVDITNRGSIGSLGNGIKGLTQVTNVADLFPNLHFANDPSDTSNFGVAKGALAGMTFKDVVGLNDEITKIARFSDGMDQLGIKLQSVSTDLTGISVASVSLTGALDAQGNAVSNAAAPGPDGITAIGGTAPDPLRVALSNDLPGQVFANVTALSAEIDKVATFVEQTMPGLLNPVVASAVSSLQQQIATENEKYRVAQDTAAKYGLDTQPLYDAESKADALLIAPARKQLDQQSLAVGDRYTVASSRATLGTTLDAFDTSADQQRDALIKSMTDTYGDTVKQTQYYTDQIAGLERTLGAERVKTAQQYAEQEAAALLNVQSTIAGVTARQDTLNGDDRGAELTTYDAKAAQEQASYSKTLTDFYGASYATTAEYQQRMTALETVEQGERLAIAKKYGEQTSAAMAQALSQAQGNVTSLYTSLGQYATKLQSGSTSPLSAQDQYSLATSQFRAVSGAASAGDYTSASQLQSFSDTFLAASRAVNGSGAGYASDFQAVLSAVQSVTTVSDALTASAQRQIAQDAADKQNAALQDSTTQIVGAITALRREMQMQQVTRAA